VQKRVQKSSFVYLQHAEQGEIKFSALYFPLCYDVLISNTEVMRFRVKMRVMSRTVKKAFFKPAPKEFS